MFKVSDLSCCDRWNPKHFGSTPFQVESTGQLTIWWNSPEPPDPDDYKDKRGSVKAPEKQQRSCVLRASDRG